MDDLSEKLAGILNDPDSMERVRQMAENLFGGEQKTQPSEPTMSADAPLMSLLGNGTPDAEDLKRIADLFARLKNTGDDHRSQLLLALRPHLSEPRQEKVDTAVKILRIIDLLPYLRESGILNL